MNVIKTFDAAMLVANRLREIVQTNDELRDKCKGECMVLLGLEPLCREASKQLNIEKYSMDQKEARFFSAFNKASAQESFHKAYSTMFACMNNSHFGIMSSYNPKNGSENSNNRHGCLSFDVTKETKLSKKGKGWARYHIAVLAGSASEMINEQLAGLGVEFLQDMVEKHKFMPEEEIRVSVLGAMKRKMYSTPSTVQIVVNVD